MTDRDLPGVRVTRQRTAVADALERVDGFRSAQDLHDMLRRDGASVGLTTVYRHLQALADAGQVDVLRTDDGEAVYRRCPTADHHHHLVCRSCGRSVEVDGPEVESWAARTAERHGFRDVSHTVEVFGTCGSCAGRT
jgi:Fur family ferric uptake transcriptional regulator